MVKELTFLFNTKDQKGEQITNKEKQESALKLFQ